MSTTTPTELPMAPSPERPPLEPLEVTEPSNDDSQYPTGIKFAATLTTMGCVLVLTGLDNGILSTAIPTITDHFHTVADIGWYVSAYRLTSTSCQFTFSKLYTLYAIKPVFLSAIAIFEAGNLLSATASSSKVLVLGRAVAGLGAAGILSGCFSFVAYTVPLRHRSIFNGMAALIEEMASVAAPLIGGVLTDRVSWRACFWINLPLGGLTMILVLFYFQNPRISDDMHLAAFEKIKRLDILGSVIFVAAMTCLLLALQWGGAQYAWSDARVVILLVLSIMLILVFAYWQYHQQDAGAVPPRIVMQRSILFGAIFAFLNNGALTVVSNYLSIYFQAVKGTTATKSGVLIIPMVIGLGIACVINGVGTSVVGYYTPFMVFTSIVAPIAAGLLSTIRVNSKLAALLAYQALLGFAVGIGIQGPQTAAATIFSPRDTPTAIAVIQFGQGIGPAIFISAAQALFTGRLTADLSHFAPGVNATMIENSGLSDLRRVLGAKRLEDVLLGYDQAVAQTLYLPVALTALSILCTAGMEWKSVKTRRS